MNKSLFAATFAATLFTLTAPHSAQAQLNYSGQFSDNLGNTYNNSTSALLGTMMNRNAMNLSLNNPVGGGGSQPPSVLGARIIKRGRATTRFAMRPFPISKYMSGVWSGNGDAEQRKKNYAEYLAQSALWRQEAQARGAQFGDYASMKSLAFVTCIEAYSGKRISQAGFKHQATSNRRFYLSSAAYQGWDTARKQEDYEKTMLVASYALYLRRGGQIEEARKVAGDWLDEYWKSDHAGVRDADDAVASLARFATAPVNSAPIRRVAPSNKTLPARASVAPDAPTTSQAPQMTLAQANAIVRYKPVAPSVLPTMLVKGKNTDELKLYESLLDAGHAQMRQLFSPAPNGQDDVGDAFTYAVMAMVSTAKSETGNLGEAGFNPQNSQELGNRLTLMLASNPAFVKQSARQKQQQAETAILLAELVSAMNGQAQKSGDAKLRARAVELARQSLQRLLGVSLDKVQVTPTEVVFES